MVSLVRCLISRIAPQGVRAGEGGIMTKVFFTGRWYSENTLGCQRDFQAGCQGQIMVCRSGGAEPLGRE